MPSVEESARAELLRALCAVACQVLGAPAASIALLDESAGELVFVAAAGAGARQIDGARFKATKGLAGEVLRTGERVTRADVASEPRFAHDIAVATGYEPDAIAVVPVRRGERVVGVLSVLDATRDDEPAMSALARQAAATLAFAEELARAVPSCG